MNIPTESNYRKSMINQVEGSNLRGEGTKEISNNLTFGKNAKGSTREVINVEEPQIVEKIVEVKVKPAKQIIKRDVVVEKIVKKPTSYNNVRQGTTYYISQEERKLLQDSIIKLNLLDMDNKRLHAELARAKQENERLKNRNY